MKRVSTFYNVFYFILWYSFAKKECASEQSADCSKSNDNQERIISTAHTVDTESTDTPADFAEQNSSDDKEIKGNGDNDLSFWSLITPREYRYPFTCLYKRGIIYSNVYKWGKSYRANRHFSDKVGCGLWPTHAYRRLVEDYNL